MLGRLARYLRFVGCDTAYGRGSTDDALLARARAEGRLLLTRDRELDRRSPSSFLVVSAVLGEQWRAVRKAFPTVPTEVSFARCTLCNGLLQRRDPAPEGAAGLPASVRDRTTPLYGCQDCGHLYWDGSHTASVRARIRSWEEGLPP
jgi:uncharacterized protein